MSEGTLYKFKWSNVDLDSYVSSRMAAATLLRREAEKLLLQAAQIEDDARQLEVDLVAVKEPKDNADA